MVCAIIFNNRNYKSNFTYLKVVAFCRYCAFLDTREKLFVQGGFTMSKKVSRAIACILLVIGIAFIIFALNNPQLSWPWSNAISYSMYLAYFILMVVLFIAPFKKKE